MSAVYKAISLTTLLLLAVRYFSFATAGIFPVDGYGPYLPEEATQSSGGYPSSSGQDLTPYGSPIDGYGPYTLPDDTGYQSDDRVSAWYRNAAWYSYRGQLKGSGLFRPDNGNSDMSIGADEYGPYIEGYEGGAQFGNGLDIAGNGANGFPGFSSMPFYPSLFSSPAGASSGSFTPFQFVNNFMNGLNQNLGNTNPAVGIQPQLMTGLGSLSQSMPGGGSVPRLGSMTQSMYNRRNGRAMSQAMAG